MPTKNSAGTSERTGGSAPLWSSVPPTHHPSAAASQLSQETPLSAAQCPPVRIEASDTTRTEFIKVIIAWLVEHGFSSTAQLLREEATAQLRDEHSQRKSLRAICRCVDEQDWEGTQRNLRKLQSRVPNTQPAGSFQTDTVTPLAGLTRMLPFLLAQQQFLELVDKDDSQRAFAFFMRSIKPFESTLSREHFRKLNYLLTCKTVGESASLYPEYRGWTPELGRSQLLRHIHKITGDCLTEPYCRQGNITHLGAGSDDALPAVSLKSLEEIAAQSIAYEMLTSEYPQLSRHRSLTTVRSLLTPLRSQLPPSEPLLQLDVNHVAADLHLQVPASLTAAPSNAKASAAQRPPLRLTACQPFLHIPAVAVGTHDGHVLWIPLTDASGVPLSTDVVFPAVSAAAPRRSPPHGLQGAPSAAANHLCSGSGRGATAVLLHTHRYAVKGMQRHNCKLLAWGGPQAVLFDVTRRCCANGGDLSVALLTDARQAATDTVWSPAAPHSSGGGASAVASENVNRGSEVTQVFSHGADATSSCFFPCGTLIAVGLSDGSVAVWDALSATKVFQNTFNESPVVSVLVNRTGTTYFAGTKDGAIFAVDVVTGMLLSTLVAPIAGELASLSLSPSSTLLLASYRGGALRLWDVLLNKQLPYHFLGAEKTASSSYPVTFGSQDDQVIAGSSDGSLYTWKLSALGVNSPMPVNDRHPDDPPHSASGTASVQQRWSHGFLVRPVSQLPLHRASVADVKMDTTYLVSCAGDGHVFICTNGQR